MQKEKNIQTPEKFMIDLNWNMENLQEAKKTLKEWDNRHNSFYKNIPAFMKKVDLIEREHLRNCIKFWEKRLLNENQST